LNRFERRIRRAGHRGPGEGVTKPVAVHFESASIAGRLRD
jgi:hypothetical protein